MSNMENAMVMVYRDQDLGALGLVQQMQKRGVRTGSQHGLVSL